MRIQAKNKESVLVINPLHRSALDAWVKGHKIGTDYDIEVKKQSGSLTARQRRYYWVCVGYLAAHLGYDKEDLHRELKRHFGWFEGTQVNPFTGEEELRLKSITKMTTKEMAEYIDQVYRFAVIEHGLMLPVPDYNE